MFLLQILEGYNADCKIMERTALLQERFMGKRLGEMGSPCWGTHPLHRVSTTGWMFFLFINAPACPQHEKCHCTLEAIDYSVVQRKAVATSNFKKFDPYLFNTNGLYFHGKEKLFLEWGYTADDAKWLQDEMERQARLTMNEALNNLLTRRSTRKYKPDMIPKEVLDQIIKAGTYVANGRGLQAPHHRGCNQRGGS